MSIQRLKYARLMFVYCHLVVLGLQVKTIGFGCKSMIDERAAFWDTLIYQRFLVTDLSI